MLNFQRVSLLKPRFCCLHGMLSSFWCRLMIQSFCCCCCCCRPRQGPGITNWLNMSACNISQVSLTCAFWVGERKKTGIIRIFITSTLETCHQNWIIIYIYYTHTIKMDTSIRSKMDLSRDTIYHGYHPKKMIKYLDIELDT